MAQQQVEWMWLDATETVTISELSRCCGMSTLELDELVDYKALPALPPAPSQSPLMFERLFSAEWVTPLREVGKMRQDYDLDLFTVAMLLESSQSHRGAWRKKYEICRLTCLRIGSIR